MSAAPVSASAEDIPIDEDDEPVDADDEPIDAAKPADTTDDTDDDDGVQVHGRRITRTQTRTSGNFHVERAVLEAAPRQEGADVLSAAPGVFIGRGEGPAVAHNYMLRGFDAEHGQDIAFSVAGLPINLPSHIHGQGYADLGFLIAPVVQDLIISEGVQDPRQGDFAVAGSIDIELGSVRRGVQLQTRYGAFDSLQHTVVWAPEGEAVESFGAARYQSTDGFGQNRAGQAGSLILQHRFGSGRNSVRTVAVAHTARSALAGVLAQRDVDAGRVCFDCVYPFPTARAQNALAHRVMLGLFLDHHGKRHANGELGIWLGYDAFRIQQNFTGFVESSRTLGRVAGRGDLIEQTNRTFSLGLTGRYRAAPRKLADWASVTIETGADGRLDTIGQTQNLLDAAVRNQTWDNRVDTDVRGVDVGMWGDLEWALGDITRINVGARADVLSYEIDDRLSNFAPASRPQDQFLPGFRRSAQGLAWGPRASLEVMPLWWLSVLAGYGEGYRSPQARILEDGESAPFSKVQSYDFGIRIDRGESLQITLGGYLTELSDDVAFDAAEGRLERIGATQRLGAVAHVVARPTNGLIASLSATYVDATLLEPPPPTAEEPQPPFEEGQSLPFVPPLLLRADVGGQTVLTDSLDGHDLVGRMGLGASFLSSRPLPFGAFADPVALVDASLGLHWGALDLGVEAYNLLDSQYAAVEYNFPSDWTPNDGTRSRTPTRHTSAGAPRTWMATLGVQL